MVKGAPPGGALHRSMDPEGAGWDVNSYLLALVGDILQVANHQRLSMNSKSRKPAPKPIPRPGAKQQARARGRNLVAEALSAGRGRTTS